MKDPTQTAAEPVDDGETCQRCGETGHDRRTLWMACFYAMHESGIPYREVSLTGPLCEKTGDKATAFGPVPEWGGPVDGSDHRRAFYTLRICKGCRSEWMGAIAQWFRSIRNPRLSCDGLYELTREEAEAFVAARDRSGR